MDVRLSVIYWFRITFITIQKLRRFIVSKKNDFHSHPLMQESKAAADIWYEIGDKSEI